MNIASKEIVNSFREKFQFLFILALFFPVILQALFGISANMATSNYQILTWGIVVSFLILDYLFIEATKKRILIWVARYVELLVMLNIFLYIPVLWIFSVFKGEVTSFYYVEILGIGLLGTMLIPMTICILLLLNFLYFQFRVFKSDVIEIWEAITKKFAK